jgi:hypothetical protein
MAEPLKFLKGVRLIEGPIPSQLSRTGKFGSNLSRAPKGRRLSDERVSTPKEWKSELGEEES